MIFITNPKGILKIACVYVLLKGTVNIEYALDR